MILLIRNEVFKLLSKKKLRLIGIVLLIFVALFAYGESYSYNRTIDRFETSMGQSDFDWTSLAKQQMSDLNRRLNSPYVNEGEKDYIEIEIEQLAYFIANDINPVTPSAARFSVTFVEQGIMMFIPLLIVILSADIVSGEIATRTIKVLLTRAVPRWKILLSKLMANYIMTTLLILVIALVAVAVSGLFFRSWGFDEPVATGFKLVDGQLNTEGVIAVSRATYMILIYSLAWFVSIVMASITTMVSVVVKNTSSAIGMVMAALIGGQFLQFFLSEWVIVKYFFVSNLNLTKYLTGTFQQIEGLSLGFSVFILLVWAIVSILISFIVFCQRDVLV